MSNWPINQWITFIVKKCEVMYVWKKLSWLCKIAGGLSLVITNQEPRNDRQLCENISSLLRSQKANQNLGIIRKGKGNETCIIIMPLCIHCAPTSQMFCVALAPYSYSFHLMKVILEQEKVQRALTTIRIME